MSKRPRPRSKNPSPSCGGVFDWASALSRLDELEARVEDPKLWDDAAAAQALMRERTALGRQGRGPSAGWSGELSDAVEFAQLADAESDEASSTTPAPSSRP